MASFLSPLGSNAAVLPCVMDGGWVRNLKSGRFLWLELWIVRCESEGVGRKQSCSRGSPFVGLSILPSVSPPPLLLM